jgi:hypothetical protein
MRRNKTLILKKGISRAENEKKQNINLKKGDFFTPYYYTVYISYSCCAWNVPTTAEHTSSINFVHEYSDKQVGIFIYHFFVSYFSKNFTVTVTKTMQQLFQRPERYLYNTR